MARKAQSLALYGSKGSKRNTIWLERLRAEHYMARKARSVALYGSKGLGLSIIGFERLGA